jgi:diguanylate cyclase
MKYDDIDSHASAELTRLALQRIAQHTAKLNPRTFSVWYEHLAGFNPGLDQAINELQDQKKPIDNVAINRLYRKFVSECNLDVQDLIRDKTHHLLTDIQNKTQETGKQASQYDTQLQRSVELMDGEQPPKLHTLIMDLRQETLEMQHSIQDLNQHLQHSQNEIRSLQQQLEHARSQAITDPLTGLLNRRGFELRTEQILEATAQQKMAAIMIDIDHFKRVNDTYGHLFGDKVIRVLADLVKSHVGNSGIAARLGGEEFGILLPNISEDSAFSLAETLRQAMENGKISSKQKNEPVNTVTVSLGVAVRQQGENYTSLLDRADQALYQSKQRGRNRVSLSNDTSAV